MKEAKIMGVLVLHRGIEVNPKKIAAIVRMRSPQDRSQIQKLTGHMVSLSRFISKLGEKSTPFFKLMWNYQEFEWAEEAEAAFQALKV